MPVYPTGAHTTPQVIYSKVLVPTLKHGVHAACLILKGQCSDVENQ